MMKKVEELYRDYLRAYRLRVSPQRRQISIGGRSFYVRVGAEFEHEAIQIIKHTEGAVIGDFIAGIRPGDTVFDIGANIGIYSLVAAAAGANVHAVEPYPPNLSALHRNTQENSFDINILEIACTSESGETTLNVPEEGYTEQSPSIDSDDGVTINCCTGDELTDEFGFPNTIKIDVEGAEGDVLSGFESTLQSGKCRAIYCEIHHETDADRPSVADFGWTESGICSLLQEYGYKIIELENRGSESHIKAVQ